MTFPITKAVAVTPSDSAGEHADTVPAARQLIPGAYERNTQTRRQPGSMGRSGFGPAEIPAGPSSMDAETTRERGKEGGRLSNAR